MTTKQFIDNLYIKKVVQMLCIFLPIMAAFLPMDQFLVIGTLTIIVLSLDIKQWFQSLIYKGSFILYFFVLYMTVLAYINKNIMGLIAVFFLILITIYISFLRKVITKRIFEILMIVIGLGSLFSLYYCTVNFYTTSTYLLYSYFMELIHISFTYIVGIADGVRISSTFIQPNYYGHLSAFIALISIFYILSSLKKIYHRQWIYLLKFVFYSLVLFVNLYALHLTQSRSAYIGLMVGAMVLVLFFDARIFIGLSIPLAIFIFTRYKSFLTLFPRLESAFQDSKYRMNLFSYALREIKDHWLVGKGFYTYPLIYQKYSKIYEIHTHNIFLEVMLDSGLIGISILVAYYSTYIHRPIKNWIKRNRFYLPLVFGILALEVANGMTDAVLIFPQSFILLSIVLLSLELNDKPVSKPVINS